jgi:hypothetical protein
MLHSTSVRFRHIALALSVVAICFLLYLRRPYSVVSDIGYQAFSAWQYVHHEVTHLLTIELADPKDLARNVNTPLYAWSPAWSALFVFAFKFGLSVGQAGRALGFLLSLAGATGWVWVAGRIGLKGRWQFLGIVLASLYCMRSRSDTLLGAGDLIIYAVAPWLLGAALAVAAKIAKNGANAVRDAALLCFAAGALYWLKYSGAFLGIALLCFLALQQLRSSRGASVRVLGVMALYGSAFLLPVLGNKIYNFERSGADAVEAAVQSKRSPPRDLKRFEQLITEAAYTSSAAIFSGGPGADWFANRIHPGHGTGDEDADGFLFRLPALAFLPVLLFVLWYSPRPYIFDLALMLIAVPFAGIPAMSFIAGDKFTFAMGRCCEPFWIFLEMVALLAVFGYEKPTVPAVRAARKGLTVLVTVQLFLFLFTPALAIPEIKRLLTWPHYQAGAADLWVVDLSRYGTREIDDKLASLVRGPDDVVVPAVYSNRGFGMDLWLEFARYRLLPLTTFSSPLFKTHGADGANFDSTTPFVSTAPLRVILVASDVFQDPGFPASVERIKKRFPQARSWDRVEGVNDPDQRVQIWVGDLR